MVVSGLYRYLTDTRQLLRCAYEYVNLLSKTADKNSLNYKSGEQLTIVMIYIGVGVVMIEYKQILISLSYCSNNFFVIGKKLLLSMPHWN